MNYIDNTYTQAALNLYGIDCSAKAKSPNDAINIKETLRQSKVQFFLDRLSKQINLC